MMTTFPGLSPSEAAKVLNVTPARIRQLLSAGELRYTRTSLGRLVDPDDVERLRREREACQARKAGR
jgi:excisionase family DNA binding protein